MIDYRDATSEELAQWDDLTVHPPGGHVLQSRAWADHQATKDWLPRYLVGSDGSAVLALTRAWPVVGGASGYVPRGPVPTDSVQAAVARLEGVTRWLAEHEVDVVASDAEVPAGSYHEELARIGYGQIEEIQPSRHRLSLHLGPRASEEGALENVSKSTRQRIRKAERDGLAVVRYDLRATDGSQNPLAYGEFDTGSEPIVDALGRFHELAEQTGERKQFGIGSKATFLDWMTRAYRAGHLVLLFAAEKGDGGGPVAGLLMYRHGGRLSTTLSGDVADARARHPGAFHLLRWRAIQLAIREDASEMDLGGVDVAGARHEPQPGEPMHGLYLHKRSFGAEWVELPGAHERVLRPTRYAVGRLLYRVLRSRR